MPFGIAFITALAVAAGVPSGPAAASQVPAAPAVQAATWLGFSSSTLDLGEMISGTPKSGSLTVTNITDGPLTIIKIVGGCGCTTIAGTPTEPVAPGASFTIDITVDPGAKTGIDLVKPVHFQFRSAAAAAPQDVPVQAQSMNVRGHVKTVVRVAPDVVDASSLPAGADAIVTLESVDGLPFRITGIEPSSFVEIPAGAAASHRLVIDSQKWGSAERPAKLTVSTDKPDATTLIIPIKAAPAVAMFRLPAAPADSAERSTIEAAQDAVILAIDEGFAKSPHSSGFSVKIHRETGMLFVHGTDADVATARTALQALPASAGVRPAA